MTRCEQVPSLGSIDDMTHFNPSGEGKRGVLHDSQDTLSAVERV